MNLADRESARMRAELAAVGIILDDPRPPLSAVAIQQSAPPVDRDAVRAVLVAAGAPDRDVEWLVASCPSLEDAKAYRPPPIAAWCARCDAATFGDEGGCIPCRAEDGP